MPEDFKSYMGPYGQNTMAEQCILYVGEFVWRMMPHIAEFMGANWNWNATMANLDMAALRAYQEVIKFAAFPSVNSQHARQVPFLGGMPCSRCGCGVEQQAAKAK